MPGGVQPDPCVVLWLELGEHGPAAAGVGARGVEVVDLDARCSIICCRSGTNGQSGRTPESSSSRVARGTHLLFRPDERW
jgi:hypothetical protein